MKYTLLDNGTDSLKKAKHSIEEFEELNRQHSYHHLKDAIIFLNHGIEILLKYILFQRNESLIFSDLNVYLQAKKQLKYTPPIRKSIGVHLQRNKSSVFDVPQKKLGNKKLTTINLKEALERVEYLCDIEIYDDFRDSIFLINEYRNDLTHHSIMIDPEGEERLIRVLKTLYDNVLNFFEIHITGIFKEVDDQRFEASKKEWEQIQRDMADYYQERAMSDVSIGEDEY